MLIKNGDTIVDRVLNPVITRDGGISCEGEISFSAGEKYVFENRYNNFMIKTKIVTAKLFNDAGIIGAAMTAVKHRKIKKS